MLALLVVALAAGAVLPPEQPPEIPREQQERLARYFAPTLLFHPDEIFLPTSPGSTTVAPATGSSGEMPAPSIDAAIGRYEQLSRAEKVARTSVFYRAIVLDAGRHRVEIEYFFYYLGNPYRSGGGVIPVHFNLWHPRDLEHASIAVDFPAGSDPLSSSPDQGTIVAVYPSAHGASMPDNVKHAARGGAIEVPVRLIVELGSHAMAMDVNGDGVFTPGTSADGPRKFTWGIRDHGAAWAWYRRGYMDPRRDETIVLGAADYRLEPVDRLEAGLDAERSAWQRAGAIHPSWAVRWFGELDEGTLDTVPPPDRRPEFSHGEGAAASRERGLTAGGSNLLAPASLFVGGRWLFPTPSLVPELLVDAEVVLTSDGRRYSVVDLLATYRLDFATRIFVGGGPLVRWWSISRQQVEWDWVAGVEFHLGHLRVRQNARRMGVLNRTAFEARVCYVF
jgi:hypothetical protein